MGSYRPTWILGFFTGNGNGYWVRSLPISIVMQYEHNTTVLVFKSLDVSYKLFSALYWQLIKTVLKEHTSKKIN